LQLLATDNEKPHILKLSGAKIIEWKDLDCETALRHIATGLVSKARQDVDDNKVFLLSKDPRLASINEGNEMQNAPSNLPYALELIHDYVRHQEGSFKKSHLKTSQCMLRKMIIHLQGSKIPLV
jgi:hypothetical protein